MRDFLHHRLRQRPPSAHIEQELGNILELVGRAMGQQQHSPTFRERGWNGFFLHHVMRRLCFRSQRKPLRGLLRCGKDFKVAVDLRELQHAPDHTLHPCQAQSSTQLFELNHAPHHGSDAGAIDVGYARQVENNPVLSLLNELIERQFNLLAIRSDADAAGHPQDDNARLDLFLDKFHVF